MQEKTFCRFVARVVYSFPCVHFAANNYRPVPADRMKRRRRRRRGWGEEG